jgi:anaerobic magnesium-protoporphyrin IX monomethyl ester cyclase
MRVLLINPPITKTDVYAKYSAGAPILPPLGLCYLGTALLEKGHEVRILDCAAEGVSASESKERIDAFAPQLIGATSTTVSYAAAREVLRTVKQSHPNITTVLGGAHISALPIPTLEECDEVDIGVTGEGEDTLAELVERLDAGRSLQDVKGTVWRQNGRVQHAEARPPRRNLDDVPFPARDLLKDLRLYSHTPFRGAKFTTTMITSRGCPFQCGYCDQSVFGRKWRHHSPEYILREMAHLKETYEVDFISIEDDNFLLSKGRTMEICREMIASRLNIGWSCLGRANEVDDEVLPLLKKAGCKSIYIGVESGSGRILKLIDKKLGVEETRKGIQLIKKHGIRVTGAFILGIPTETREDMEKTIELSLSLPLDGVSFFIFTPYPNTPLRDLAEEHGKVSTDWRSYSAHPSLPPYVPNGMGDSDLLDIQADAYRRFLLRPGYLLTHLGLFANRRAVRNGLRFLKDLVAG